MDFIISKIWVDYDRAPDMAPGSEIKVKLTLQKKHPSQKHYEVRFILPEGWTVSGGKKNLAVTARNGFISTEYTITAGENVASKNRGIIEVTCEGHSDVALLPLVFLG